MLIREALLTDIPAMQWVRGSVRENVLSDPARVPYQAYVTYLTERGKGWVADVQDQVVGFAVVDTLEHNVWALFLHPQQEGQGLGRLLQTAMLRWYFSQTQETLWLSTEPGTRAEGFYLASGWEPTGPYGSDEIRFEMRYDQWQQLGQPSAPGQNRLG